MLSVITRKVAIGLLVFAATAASWAGFATWQWVSAKQELGAAEESAQGLADTAEGNAEQLMMCVGRLNTQIREREQAEQAEREANRMLEEQTRRARDLAEAERQARREAYRNDCKDWSDRVACPAAIDSLRRARGDEDQDS